METPVSSQIDTYRGFVSVNRGCALPISSCGLREQFCSDSLDPRWNNSTTLARERRTVRIFPLPLRGGFMWALTKQSRQMALEHSQLQSVLLQRTAELQILTQRLLKVQDEERRRLSRDLHDHTGQTLTALKLSIALLQESCKGDRK